MYKVEQELRGQFRTIEKTVQYIVNQREKLKEFLQGAKSICVSGCGSSFYVAKSTAMQFLQKTGIPSYAITAGDLLVNFDAYEKVLEHATLILLSRSGSTTELHRMASRCRERYPNIKMISICAVEGAPISNLADLNIEIPWAFDQAVCQTQTVSNLFISGLTLCALKSNDSQLLDDILAIEKKAEDFATMVEPLLEDMAKQAFENVVVLADSDMAGLAEEGALAFKEICHRPSNFYNVLDVRHGPILIINEKTLVVVLISRGDLHLQTELVNDMKKRGSFVLVLRCTKEAAGIDGITDIQLPPTDNDDVSAVFMLYCIQFLCLKHALYQGVDPDKPEGLDPWIKLNV
ncbi:SIS domain-containing protein [Lachnospiraceae bacterium ZAX-1]